ncbi:uncharacterized protein LOC111703549 [Eurytemora carolleeae]|uniref:uncharacterized protein LOC111703549 n=1 Tax=Eurytemora carolleeae TaxID=1294199 RepID=UPI000C77131C|nr:uncharacterized protein LOC111703549 [Eurytemora carolleeae]XP_023331284.1 uncharacterized protein LOC111703549 [Eurytemora carolleeae]XP_023331285.1 uncharacterized protein LOC111703549 [Eurytemora carolleeae]XP_023331287.1 uncharacterized protein LOC111703549 [Eurytemora carolleeae]|eukprot:XP_023331283.1 uncharacterized protein LOC111703549 [Eurytemora affinis]
MQIFLCLLQLQLAVGHLLPFALQSQPSAVEISSPMIEDLMEAERKQLAGHRTLFPIYKRSFQSLPDYTLDDLVYLRAEYDELSSLFDRFAQADLYNPKIKKSSANNDYSEADDSDWMRNAIRKIRSPSIRTARITRRSSGNQARNVRAAEKVRTARITR